MQASATLAEYQHLRHCKSIQHMMIKNPKCTKAMNPYFLPSLGLKKLVNLLILLVLTFFKLSTPLDPGAAFRFTPALRAASDFD